MLHRPQHHQQGSIPGCQVSRGEPAVGRRTAHQEPR